MKEELKQQLHALIENMDDEAKLQLLMEDAEAYLADTEEEADDLTDEESTQIDEAEKEVKASTIRLMTPLHYYGNGKAGNTGQKI